MKNILLFTAILFVIATNTFSQVPNYVPTNGLVGYWPFNGNAIDESINTNDGTVNGATLTSDRNGFSNSAFLFNSNQTNNINFGNVVGNFSSNDFTVSLWFTISSQQGYLISKRYDEICSPSNNWWELRPAGFVICQGSSGNSVVTSNNYNYGNNTWNLITIVRDLNNFKCFINGNLINTTTSNVNFNINNNTNLLVGMVNAPISGNVAKHDGKIDDIGIWNRALTQCEIQNLYNSQLGSANTSTTLTQTALDSLTLNGQTYTQSGTYTQVIPNAAGCDSTITLNLSLSYTGISELKDGIRIYPNPTFDNLTIERTSSLNSNYVLVDSQGGLVLQGELTETITHLSLGKLEYGNYILQLENQSVPIRIVKQ